MKLTTKENQLLKQITSSSVIDIIQASDTIDTEVIQPLYRLWSLSQNAYPFK